MKKTKLVEEVKKDYPHVSKKDINGIIDKSFNVIAEHCEKGDPYTQNNFGKFEKRIRAKRKGRNIETGEIIDIAEANTIKFTISKTRFKKMNNKG